MKNIVTKKSSTHLAIMLNLYAIALLGTVAAQAAPTTANCSALVSAKLPNTVIKEAKTIFAGTLIGFGFTSAGKSPKHCVVRGEIAGREGVKNPDTGSTHYGINFELRLPYDWNGRFFYQGGGGSDGYTLPALGTIPSQPSAQQRPALWRGYAVLSTDGGHNSGSTPLGLLKSGFGVDPKARIDYGYASIGQATPVAKAIVNSFYGKPPHFAYFLGCSKGGQEAMQAAQRYGDQFDGIVAGHPGFRLPHAATAQVMSAQALAVAAQAMRPFAKDLTSGKPLIWAALSKSDLQLVVNGVMQSCDALDGLSDQIILNPSACVGRFNPALLQCTGSKQQNCLAKEQVQSLNAVFGPLKNAAGQQVYPSFPYDTGISSGDLTRSFIAWRLGIAGIPSNTSMTTSLVDGSLKYIFLSPPRSQLDIFSVKPNDILNGISATGADASTGRIYSTASVDFMEATSRDYSSLRSKNGKLIVYHGDSDPVFSSNDTVDYFRQLDADYGSEREQFVRLFRVPGAGHCGGGDYTLDSIDTLTTIENWVEHGQAPEFIVAKPAKPNSSKLPADTTRPLCSWPNYAAYRGSGNPTNLESFQCVSP